MRSKLLSIKNVIKLALLALFTLIIFREIILYHFPGFFQISYVTGGNYISFAYFMQFILELLFEILVIVLVGTALFGGKSASAESEQYTFNNIAFALSVSLPLIFLFNPIDGKRIAVDSFSRVIGQGVIANWDVKKVTSNFAIFFCLFAVTFGSALKSSNRYLRNAFNKEQEEANKACKVALSVNVGWLGYYIFTYFIYSEASNLYNIGTVLLLLLISFILLYNILKLNLSFKTYFLFLVCSLGMSYGCCAVFFRELEGGRTVAGIWFIMVTAVILVLKFGADKLKRLFQERMNYGIIFLFCAAIPLILSFYIEFINVLNQWGIFVAYPRKWFVIVILVLTSLVCLLARLFGKSNIKKDISEFIYTELIIGFSCMSTQLNLVNLVYANIFETANSGVLISDFLNYGKIPIVEHYGGHMLSYVIGGIFYGVINQDYPNAVYTMYNLATPILAVLFYKFMKTFTNREEAFLTSLFFPYELLWSYFGMAAMVLLAIAFYLKKCNWIRALLLWDIAAGCCLYRLDLGAVALESAVIVLVLYAIVKKEKKIIYDNLLGGGIAAIFYIVLWFILCLWKNISPLDRLREFIGISASNYTWAYSSIGKVSLVAFGWFYVFLPFLVIASGILLFLNKRIRTLFSEIELVIFVSLICIYFFNYARGLVRHSVVELGVTSECQMAMMIYIVVSILLARLLKDKALCVPFMAVFIVINSLIIGGNSYLNMSQLYQATNKIEPIVEGWSLSRFDRACEELFGEERYTYWENISNNQTIMDRTVRYETNEIEVYELEEAFSVLLNEDETFLDFVCRSFFYAAYGKEDPVYVSQTPSMLSNEFTQEQYIREIKDQYESIPIVIMPSLSKGIEGFDGVKNSTRYYKVVEYIYQNYRPLCMVNGYSLWCANDRYEDLSSKVQGVYEPIDWMYESNNHTFNLQKLPYIWANYDEKKAIDNIKVLDLLPVSENVFYIDNVEEIEKEKGNYLLISLSSNMDQDVIISAGNQSGSDLSSVTFSVCEGESSYLIRISSDYYWYNNLLDTFTIYVGGENGVINGSMSILEGD